MENEANKFIKIHKGKKWISIQIGGKTKAAILTHLSRMYNILEAIHLILFQIRKYGR